MSDVLSFSELDGQREELLPARTLLSMSAPSGTSGGDGGSTVGNAVATMLGFTPGGQATAGPDGAPGHGSD